MHSSTTALIGCRLTVQHATGLRSKQPPSWLASVLGPSLWNLELRMVHPDAALQAARWDVQRSSHRGPLIARTTQTLGHGGAFARRGRRRQLCERRGRARACERLRRQCSPEVPSSGSRCLSQWVCCPWCAAVASRLARCRSSPRRARACERLRRKCSPDGLSSGSRCLSQWVCCPRCAAVASRLARSRGQWVCCPWCADVASRLARCRGQWVWRTWPRARSNWSIAARDQTKDSRSAHIQFTFCRGLRTGPCRRSGRPSAAYSAFFGDARRGDASCGFSAWPVAACSGNPQHCRALSGCGPSRAACLQHL